MASSPGGDQSGTTWGVVRRLLSYLRPYRVSVIAIVVTGLGSIVLNVLGPTLLGRATNLIFAGVVSSKVPPTQTQEQWVAQLRAEGHADLANVVSTVGLLPGHGIDFGALSSLLGMVLGLYLVGALCMLVQGRLVAKVVQKVMCVLRERAQEKLARLPVGYFDNQPKGDLLSRVTNDMDNVQISMQQTIGQLISSLLSVVAVLVVMLAISPLLALIVFTCVPMTGIAARVLAKKAKPQYGMQWMMTGALNTHIEETYSRHSVVKSFNRREHAEQVFDEHNGSLFAVGARASVISGLIGPVANFVTNFNYLLVAVVGALRVVNGSISIGEVQAFVQYSGMFSRPIVDVASFSGQLQSGVASAQRIFELLDSEEQEESPPRLTKQRAVKGQIVFDRVGFRYRPDSPLIESLSLVVEPGETVAIVGSTGAGKTTLGNLLLRFYEVEQGRILLDGMDTALMSREELRTHIGFVSQDTWLFDGTIAENIAYGKPDATREEIEAAAKATCVDRFVRLLPDGYDTRLGEDASTLSAGERQLVTIARAFLASPTILLLDEATSSIDTRTEAFVQQAMNSLRTGRTSLVIAHRLSTIRDADLIVVMDQGRIVEWGTHKRLLMQGGVYAQMHSSSADAAVRGRTNSSRTGPRAQQRGPIGVNTATSPMDLPTRPVRQTGPLLVDNPTRPVGRYAPLVVDNPTRPVPRRPIPGATPLRDEPTRPVRRFQSPLVTEHQPTRPVQSGELSGQLFPVVAGEKGAGGKPNGAKPAKDKNGPEDKAPRSKAAEN